MVQAENVGPRQLRLYVAVDTGIITSDTYTRSFNFAENRQPRNSQKLLFLRHPFRHPVPNLNAHTLFCLHISVDSAFFPSIILSPANLRKSFLKILPKARFRFRLRRPAQGKAQVRMRLLEPPAQRLNAPKTPTSFSLRTATCGSFSFRFLISSTISAILETQFRMTHLYLRFHRVKMNECVRMSRSGTFSLLHQPTFCKHDLPRFPCTFRFRHIGSTALH